MSIAETLLTIALTIGGILAIFGLFCFVEVLLATHRQRKLKGEVDRLLEEAMGNVLEAKNSIKRKGNQREAMQEMSETEKAVEQELEHNRNNKP